MQNHFNPRVGRLGTMLGYTQSATIGTGGTNLTANVTTTLRIPTPVTRCAIAKLAVSAGGIAADADGALLATINKRDNVNAANVPLTAPFSLEVDFITVANTVYRVPLLSTLTDAQRIFQVGDQLYVDIVSNSAAIDTQPTYTVFMAEWFILE